MAEVATDLRDSAVPVLLVPGLVPLASGHILPITELKLEFKVTGTCSSKLFNYTSPSIQSFHLHSRCAPWCSLAAKQLQLCGGTLCRSNV